jgi:ABC-2 type transport system ATP-binding protein
MIKVEHLTKEFKKPVIKPGLKGIIKALFSAKYDIKVAVNDISFEIQDGEIVGYIGANGAGKSTTIKMMCGILTPTNGIITIDGIEPYKQRSKVAQNIGVVFGQRSRLWWDLPLKESYMILKEVYAVSNEDFESRMKYFSEIFGLNEFINSPVRTLSLGQRMRAELTAAMLHNPKIIFLDEPTIGLDVLVKEKMRDAIKEINQKFNTTIILTTHDMGDIENLCKRIIIIDEGNIIYDGSLNTIKNKFGDIRTIVVQVKTIEELQSFDVEKEFKNQLISHKIENNQLTISFDASKIHFSEITNVIFSKLNVEDMQIKENSIDSVVKHIYEKGL